MATLFEYPVLIKEGHLDTFGHVNNATYLQIYEEARWDFITQGGYGLQEVQDKQMGPVILELNLRFRRELKNREKIVIKSQYDGDRNTMMSKVHQEMVLEDGTIASTLDLLFGLMDLKTRKLIRPTADWYKALGATEKL